jgi:hypothetical protein
MGGGMIANGSYKAADMYVDYAEGNKLYMSGTLWVDNRVLLSNGPVRDVQISDGTVWFINKDDEVIKIKDNNLLFDKYISLFKGPEGERKSDISQVVKTEIVYSGRAKSLRVLDGRPVILQIDGTLF